MTPALPSLPSRRVAHLLALEYADDLPLLIDEYAERRVLSGLLHSPDLHAPQLLERVIADDFGLWRHKVVWQAAWDVWVEWDAPVPLDELYLLLVRKRWAADLAANPALWLAELWLEDQIGSECVYYAIQVRWLAQRRAAVHAARETIRDAVDGVSGPQTDSP